MIDIKASAPGKVIIAGEYAVLDGAPAICMAVNRRAQVSVKTNSEERYTISAPGVSDNAASYASIEDAADAYPLLAAVWQELQVDTPDFLNIVLDSSGFSDAAAEKIGIGSSAALTVALTAAFENFSAQDRDVLSMAIAAHRRLQGGAGSGADIACSFAGGIIEYRKGDVESTALGWPAGLNYALLWSGVSADTGQQISKLDSAKAQISRAALFDSAEVVAQVWRSGDAGQVVQELDAYTAMLRRFDVDHELGIFDAGHAALVDQSESTEVVYKPCGAGGGDLGIAVSTEQSALAAFVDTARQHNFKVVDLASDTNGVVVDGTKQ